jgi:hypothetical protein
MRNASKVFGIARHPAQVVMQHGGCKQAYQVWQKRLAVVARFGFDKSSRQVPPAPSHHLIHALHAFADFTQRQHAQIQVARRLNQVGQVYARAVRGPLQSSEASNCIYPD